MGKFTLAGILFSVGIFLTLLGIILDQINIVNPYTGQEGSIFLIIVDWIIP